MRRATLSKSKSFVFKGKNIKGDKVKGKISGLNKEILFKELEYKGIFVEKINRDYHIFKSKKIKTELLLNFIEEWYNLEITKLTTQDCLEVIKDNCLNKKFKIVLTDILTNANAGMSLHECFREYNEYFPDIFLNQIINGIKVGNILDTLSLLKDYYKEQVIFQSKIKKSLIYPKLLVLILIGVIFVLSKFIIPSFYELFNVENDILNSFSLRILKFLIVLGDNYIFFLVGFFLIFIFLKQLVNKTRLKKVIDKLKIYIFKKYYRLYITSIVSSTLFLYWNLGVNKIEALDMINKVIDNDYYKGKFSKSIEMIRSGMMMGESLDKIKIFDKTFTKMIKIGEKNNCINDNLYNAGIYYQNKLNGFVDNMIKLLEPLLILLISMFVLSIILIIFIPILNGFKVVM